MSERKAWKYCVVGNIVHDRIDDNGVPRHGTAAFRGGAKVYLCGKGWTFSSIVIDVVGLTRGRHFQVIDTRMADIENLRVQKVYSPGILDIMNNFEFERYWWGDTEEDRKDAEAFIEKWNSEWVRQKVRKEKYYPYSVRECLTSLYGNDSLWTMRHPHPEEQYLRDEERPVKHIPTCWCRADMEVLEALSEISFLTGTIVTDDYIAYTLRRRDADEVILMFMTDEDNPPFRIEPEYARRLVNEWQEKGYRPIFFHICVGTEYHHENQYSIRCGHRKPEGVFIYTLETVNGEDRIVSYNGSAWDAIYSRILTASKENDPSEYECIFDPEVRIMKDKEEVGKGIDAIIHFFIKNGPATAVLEGDEYGSRWTWNRCLTAGEYKLNAHVSMRNLVAQIDIEEYGRKTISDHDFPVYESLKDRIPAVTGIRALDPVQMHALAVQMSYEDNTFRNYYIKTFDDFTVPDSCNIDGYSFTCETLFSVRLDEQQNAVFSNGMIIPRHILFHRGWRQVNVVKPEYTYGDPDGFEIKPVYRLPNKENKNRKLKDRYWGNLDELFGPCEPWLDKNGDRLTDIAIVERRHVNYSIEATPVIVEPTFKFGFIKEDGTWLAPPVFDDVLERNKIGCMIAFIGKGEDRKKYLIREENGAVETEYEMHPNWLSWIRNPFNAEPGDRTFRFRQGAYDDDYEPVKLGKWGLMDSHGEIVVEPQYVFVLGYHESDCHAYEHYAFVGREIDGKVMVGVINDQGEEIIPCKYYEIHHCKDDVFAWREKDHGPYGVFDWRGKLVSEPKFWYVSGYDEEHRLLGVGEDEDHLGLYSLDEDRMIIKEEYDWFDFDKTFICCENYITGKTHYYDYEGRFLTEDGQIENANQEGTFELWKGHTMQLIRADGTEVTKPETMLWGSDQRDAVEKGNYFSSRGANPATWGLNRADGTELIPAVYDKVNIIKDLVFARVRPYRLTTTSETLYQINGKLLMQGCFRHMGFEGEEWDPYDRFFTVQTPLGTEYCKLIDHERIRAQKEFNERNKHFFKAMHERDVPTKYLVDVFLPRMRECKTEEEKDEAREVTAVEIEAKFPIKKNDSNPENM